MKFVLDQHCFIEAKHVFERKRSGIVKKNGKIEPGQEPCAK